MDFLTSSALKGQEEEEKQRQEEPHPAGAVVGGAGACQAWKVFKVDFCLKGCGYRFLKDSSLLWTLICYSCHKSKCEFPDWLLMSLPLVLTPSAFFYRGLLAILGSSLRWDVRQP